ncbi:MAG: hypothetical protein GXP62_05205 [Oligoflexia bacterium]|nr:hypothetical protein [Oligoflexia bacterium]
MPDTPSRSEVITVTPPEQDAPVLTWKRAQNMQVVGLLQGAFAGRLDDFQFDLETHAIYGWRVKTTGVWGRSGAVAAAKLSLIGRDVAFIGSVDQVVWGSTDRKNVVGRAWASAYRGTQAITRRGRALGAVQDFVIDAQGSRVTGILLHGDRLLPLDGGVNSGPAAVIAADEGVVVELGSGEEDPEGVRWWHRLRKALGVGEDDSPRLNQDEQDEVIVVPVDDTP